MRISDWSSDVCSSDLQTGRTSTVDASSIGNGNQITGSQTAFVTAQIEQRGDDNVLTFDQQGYFEGSRMIVSQDGLGNLADIYQGDGNRMNIAKAGTYNIAEIHQNDYHNEIDFTQSGDSNRQTVEQNGLGGRISGSSTGKNGRAHS